MKLLSFLFCFIIGETCFSQITTTPVAIVHDPGILISGILTINGQGTPDVPLINDTVQVVLKSMRVIDGEPAFFLNWATAIYGQKRVYYFDNPVSSDFGGLVDAVYRLPVERSRVDRTLIRIIVKYKGVSKEFPIDWYHEIIPANHFFNP